jgi:hypothetical protein
MLGRRFRDELLAALIYAASHPLSCSPYLHGTRRVLLKATISKSGEILDLHAECGPEILLEPSLKAVREWKYRPYLLRGEPVAVQTTIEVIFALGDKKKLPFGKDSCPVE